MGKNQRLMEPGNLMAGVYYRLPDEGEPVDKAFLLQALSGGTVFTASCPAILTTGKVVQPAVENPGDS